MSQSHECPRVVPFVTVKRNAVVPGRTYGHWWVEIDGEESYGWWPAATPLRFRDAIGGTGGVLNGVGSVAGGSPTRDPNHGELADHVFNPVLIRPWTDDEVRVALRSFASNFTGGWRWATRPTMNCRLFQLALFDAAGLVDGRGNFHTRGHGCPALGPGRRLLGRLTGRRRWPRNLPPPSPQVPPGVVVQ